LAGLLEKTLAGFAGHYLRYRHQYLAIKTVREKLEEGHVLLHVDFSENLPERLGVEPQAKHFGNRRQIVIHQGMLYMKVHCR
jgi:hypothetical protein